MNPLTDDSRLTSAPPSWLKYLLSWPNPFLEGDEPLTITYRRWMHGDENRLLPMPLRYAAAHPCSASAIIAVLKGKN